ncbi:hypothetical protein F1880_008508 [Penicillium rolfsii]|nr:hypothetical protein F1880_008508 [Penicillium rolfsii]
MTSTSHSLSTLGHLPIQLGEPKNLRLLPSRPTQLHHNIRLVHLGQLRRHPTHISHYPSNLPPIQSFSVWARSLRLPKIPPNSCTKHRITLNQALVVGGDDAAPLNEEVLEVLVADGAGADIVQVVHAVFGVVRKVID